MSEHGDSFLDLCERFTARGANIRGGSIHIDMIKHLLDSVEALEQANGGRPKNLDVRAE